MKKLVSIDIDGILNDYPKIFVKYANFVLRKKYKNIIDLKKSVNKSTYGTIKKHYRHSFYKYNYKINSNVLNLIKFLIRMNVNIIFLTRRNLNNKFILSNTTKWLRKHNIKFKGIYKKNKKNFLRFKPIFHVDDEHKKEQNLKNVSTRFIIFKKNRVKKILVIKKILTNQNNF
jgi:hypothetical protein